MWTAASLCVSLGPFWSSPVHHLIQKFSQSGFLENQDGDDASPQSQKWTTLTGPIIPEDTRRTHIETFHSLESTFRTTASLSDIKRSLRTPLIVLRCTEIPACYKPAPDRLFIYLRDRIAATVIC